MIRFLALAFIFFAPFATWFALSGWLRFPVVILLLLTVVSFIPVSLHFIKKPLSIIKDKEDILLIFFLMAVWVSFSLGFYNTRSFNHSLSYTFAIALYFILFKFIIYNWGIHVNTISKVIMYSVIVNNLIIIVEWMLLNVWNIEIRGIFLTGGPTTTNMTYYPHPFFKSVAGVGEEPGGTASLLNIYFPIGLWYLSKFYSKTKVTLYTVTHCIGLIFLASVAGIFFLLVSYLLVVFYDTKSVKKILLNGLYTAIIVSSIFVLIYEANLLNTQDFFTKYYSYMEEKITLSDKNISASDRKNMWKHALTDWLDAPIIGNGPGYGVETYRSGYFNTFLTILADIGLIGFAFFIFFLLIIILKLFKLAGTEKFYLMVSIGCLFLHSSIYYVYYHEPFWLPIILIQIFYKKIYVDKLKIVD